VIDFSGLKGFVYFSASNCEVMRSGDDEVIER
jgi:hypothetical protein